MRGSGSANVGVPQGSPLSPVVFLIWMAPILGEDGKEDERGSRSWDGSGSGRGTAIPSFVDGMCTDIVVWEGGCNMQRVETNVKRIVREVAEECKFPIETDKEEVLHIRKSRKKKNADRRYVKWLGVIFDDSLDFDMHWKSRSAKARKALGALSGVGGAQWGMCLGGGGTGL